jgi:hypothetical protein
MVKQIVGSAVSAIKGQNYLVMPPQTDIEAKGFYETKQSIINRLDNGKGKSVSKLQTMNKVGMSMPRVITDDKAMKERRKVIPFNDMKSPFLNFSTGRGTKTATRQRVEDTIGDKAIVNVNTNLGRL